MILLYNITTQVTLDGRNGAHGVIVQKSVVGVISQEDEGVNWIKTAPLHAMANKRKPAVALHGVATVSYKNFEF